MRRIAAVFCLIAGLTVFLSCEKTDFLSFNRTLSVSPSELILGQDKGHTVSFEVNANTVWTVKSDSDWIRLSPKTGFESGTVTITAAGSNFSENRRTASVMITVPGTEDHTIHIVQEPKYGIMTGNDGRVYRTVTIGSQTWMMENLRETRYRNGDEISEIQDNAEWTALTNGARCALRNNEKLAETYGYIYNWYAVDDSRNIAPEGWRTADIRDWGELEAYLGSGNPYHVGGMLKTAGTYYWDRPNKGADNSSGFSALPGGYRIPDSIGGYSPGFYPPGTDADFWTASESAASNNKAVKVFLYYDSDQMHRFEREKNFGFYVRLIRED